MAIQMRRGQLANFDPTKMLPGEWAVSIDSDTTRQKVYMCFAPGVVKEMALTADISSYIQEYGYALFDGILCTVEDSTTATSAYAAGDYLIANETFYVATAAIAVGDTITPGTNVTATSVDAVLKNLASGLAGKKNTQTAKEDPTASGNSLSFIDSITQNTNGEITATKKTVTTDAEPTTNSTNPVQSGGVKTALDDKVDKVEGMQLSTEDYTTAEKNKLANIEAGATRVIVDSELDELSGDAVENAVVTEAINALNADLANKADDSVVVKSVNSKTPTNGAVEINAEDIPADGIGDKSVSGNPLTIEDGMASVAKELSVTLEPVQDLHGYSNPWPAGGGKNKCDCPDGTAVTTGDITQFFLLKSGTYTFSAEGYRQDEGSARFKVLSADSTIAESTNFSGNTYTKRTMTFTLENDTYVKVAVMFLTSYSTLYYRNVMIEEGSTATAFAPYSNICPIYPAGMKNLLDTSIAIHDIGQTYALDGSTMSPSKYGYSVSPIVGNYTLSYQDETFEAYIYGNIVDSNDQWISSFKLTENTTANIVSLNVANGQKVKIFAATATESRIEGKKIQLELGNKTAYEPYYEHGRAKVERHGINQWDEEWEVGTIDTATGQNATWNEVIRSKNYIPVLPSGSYYFKTPLNIIPYYYDANKAFLGFDSAISNAVKTVPSNCYYMRFRAGTTYGTTYNHDISINYPSTETGYHPYEGQSAIIPFSSDVYGGQVDFVSGKCRVTKASESFVFTPGGAGNGLDYRAYILSPMSKDNPGSSTGKLCSIVGTYSWAGTTDQRPHFYIGGPNAVVYVPEGTMYGETVQFVYELATPIELTLTPAQLTLLEGTNILTADGTINLTYLGSMASNVQDEIDEFENGLNNVIGSIAFIENQTAKTSHVVGDYVILNGIFCKVIAAISAGETLSFGTNIQATTIGAELRAIWAEISA